MDAAFILAWQYSVGLVFPEDLPMAAAELPAEGQDSRALRDLAGRSRNDDTAELQDLLREAMLRCVSRSRTTTRPSGVCSTIWRPA